MRFKTLLILFIVFCSANCFAHPPTARLSVKVLNSEGVPIEGVEAFANFTGSKAKIVRGTTDKSGLFTATGETTSLCGITVKKEGYYDSGYSFKHILKRGTGSSERWEPWNPIGKIILKEIRNPTQMYAKNTSRMKIPALNKAVGFDLEKGDWVTPYGKGIIQDFIFIFNANDNNAKPSDEKWQCSYKLLFSNTKDGIQEYYPSEEDRGEYIWPYEAPSTGYQSELNGFTEFSDGHVKTNYDDKKNYMFRVRTQLDKQGNIIDARYGKIRGDIRRSLGDSFGTVRFIYYFNPTGNRNLEYGIKNPLFKFSRREYEYKVSSP